MFDSQSNLISYSQIHSDVDQLFRAYLDTALMELANVKFGDSKGYWTGVIALRKDKLNYIEWAPGVAATARAPSVQDLIDTMPPAGASDQGFRYLFWFEVRADYWSRATKPELEALVAALPPSERLGILFSEARVLEGRLATLPENAVPEETESDGTRAVTSGEPLPREAFLKLLAMVKVNP